MPPAPARAHATAFLDVDRGVSLTYAESHHRVRNLARALSARGVTAGDRVAMLCTNRAEVLEALSACRLLGALLVPLSWRLAVAELCAACADCAPRLVLADQAHAGLAVEVARAAGAHLVDLDGELASELAGASGALDAQTPPLGRDEDGVLILYTSGTSGVPKGAVLSWRQLVFNARATAARCALGPGDRCLAMLPMFHTGGLGCLALPTLHAGGTVVVMARFDAARAAAAIEAHRITCTIAVPTMYQMLLDAGLQAAMTGSLRWCLVGGAPTPPDLAEAGRERGLALAHGYGATEVGPNCFSFGLGAAAHTVGQPMPGTTARLVDHGGADVECGQVGELLLRGPHVMLGYWKRPAETAAVLTPDGWYRTGDLARRDVAGDYEIVGRKKEMFISGGENVYPAEVERVLCAHPAVSEAAVVGVPDPRWGEVGMAVVVKRTEVGDDALVAVLSAWAREHLAGFKVPRRWQVVAALPRNATGKVQKHLLAARPLRSPA